MLQTKTTELLRSTHNSLVLNKAQTAKELHVSQATIDRMRKVGEIESIKIGGTVMFSLEEIARVIAS